MATATQSIEVQLPEGASPSLEDLETLRMTFQAIVGLRYEGSREWQKVLAHLERGGWRVDWGLRWHVEARRGRELEEACGHTRDEAFAKLNRFVGAELPTEGTP